LNAFPLLSGYWTHDLDPFLWRFPGSMADWGPGGLRWYGISYLAGFVGAYFLLKAYYKRERSPYDGEQVMNLMTFLILGVLLGGRMGYALLYRGGEFLEDPLLLLRVWEGGMASHGGFIGVCLAILLYARHSGQSPLPIGDLIVSVVPPGLFFGRVANFINGELWGRPTEVSWGILFPKAPDFLQEVARHPSDVAQRVPGRLCGEFLVAYALARILNEFFREPDASLILGMTRGQFYSLFLALGGISLIMIAERRARKASE
jgi:phosphatidylglycerol:prolipoprotein diacylglycerol transferase